MDDFTPRVPQSRHGSAFSCPDEAPQFGGDASDHKPTLLDHPLTLQDQVRLIGRLYDFTQDDTNCLLSPQGRPLQMAMRLTRRARPAETLSVICKDIDGDLFWFIEDLRSAPFDAGAYIAAVSQRVEQNRALRQTHL